MDEHDETSGPAAAIASLPGLYKARDLAGVARVLIRVDWPAGTDHPWEATYRHLVRGITPDDAAELIHLIAREVRAGADRPAGVLWELSRPLPDTVVPGVCVDWLTGADRNEGAGGDAWSGEGVRMAAACVAAGTPLSPGVLAAIRRMASHPAWAGKPALTELAARLRDPVLNPGEAWSDAALADVARLGQAWQDLLDHAVTAAATKPSARWEKTARGLLSATGEAEAAERIGAWLALVGQPRTLPRIERGRGGTNDLFDGYNVAGMRGLAWMLGFAATDAESARTLAAVAQAALRRVPGVGPRNPRVAHAAVYALSLMPGAATLAQLARLATQNSSGAMRAQLDRVLAARAAELGVSREELEELAVPGFGLTEVGRRAERFGGATAEVTIRGRAVDLTWRTEAGKAVKSAPARVRAQFPAEVKELKSAVADIEKMVLAQTARLECLYLARRSWDFAHWTEYYADHPLVGTLARRLIWLIDHVPVGYADGRLRTVTDVALAPAPDARVELWHPIGRAAAEISAWRDWLDRHQITQPFKQAHREVYPLTPAELDARDGTGRFAAHVLRQHQLHALAPRRGWQSRLRFMAEDGEPPLTRHLPQWHLRAEFLISGVGQDPAADGTESGAFRYVTTDRVRFYPVRDDVTAVTAVTDGPIPLADIPPLVLTEIFRDIDLFVSVCAIGNDPAVTAPAR